MGQSEPDQRSNPAELTSGPTSCLPLVCFYRSRPYGNASTAKAVCLLIASTAWHLAQRAHNEAGYIQAGSVCYLMASSTTAYSRQGLLSLCESSGCITMPQTTHVGFERHECEEAQNGHVFPRQECPNCQQYFR